MKDFQIKVTNLTRDMVLARLMQLGFTFSTNEFTTLEKVKKFYSHTLWTLLFYQEEAGVIHGSVNDNVRLPNLSLDELFSDSFVYKPFETIQVILNKDYVAKVSEDDIRVNCQTFSFEKFDELANAVKKAREFKFKR